MRALNRRHRRWRNRHTQPVLLAPNEPRFLDALAALGRLIFRYRSELAPIGTAAALDVAALYLHHRDPAWWPWIAGLSLCGVVVLLLSPLVERRAERRYAAIATAAAGVWLSIATALGPARDPLQPVLLLITVVGGAPWWAHRRRRARVRVERTIEAWPDVAEKIGLAGSRVMSAVVDAWGWRARIALQNGQTTADVIARVPAIESSFGTRPGAVRVEADPAHAGRVSVRVLAEDPHANVLPWPGPSIRSIADPIPLGVFEDAEPVQISILGRHVLIGGISGSGKSGVLNTIVGNLVACEDVELWGVDLKGGMELRPWESCLKELATTPAEATALMKEAVARLERRARALGDESARIWTPTPQAPALVVVVDEYAELPDNAPDAVKAADSIGRRGRAPLVTLLTATQRPTQKAMGEGTIRSQMDVRVCLRVRERRDVDLVLDKGMLAAGWHAHTLDAPGKFLISAEGFNQPRRARAFLVTDDDVRRTAARYPIDRTLEPLRRELVTLPDPEQTLREALSTAPEAGLSVPELKDLTGMGRTWIYDRLQQLATDGEARQVSRGRWRAET
ncbi:FtsK/SpoIIIE domain-containing protein [Actinoplanes sp. NPDC049316]|uniref:FtsK/SpoIIIE domain-containing protein n=1 Tax=Actinoplanes sp. NPDC049316 TaxID=3154727 RepID=UPI00343EED0C